MCYITHVLLAISPCKDLDVGCQQHGLHLAAPLQLCEVLGARWQDQQGIGTADTQ